MIGVSLGEDLAVYPLDGGGERDVDGEDRRLIFLRCNATFHLGVDDGIMGDDIEPGRSGATERLWREVAPRTVREGVDARATRRAHWDQHKEFGTG